MKKMITALVAAFCSAALFAEAYVVVHPRKNGPDDPIGKAINDVRFSLEIIGCRHTVADYPQINEDLLRDTKVLFLHSDLAPEGKAKAVIEAYEKRGFLAGTVLTVWRVLRCNPFCTGGYDPVPERGFRRVKREDLLEGISLAAEDPGRCDDSPSA